MKLKPLLLIFSFEHLQMRINFIELFINVFLFNFQSLNLLILFLYQHFQFSDLNLQLDLLVHILLHFLFEFEKISTQGLFNNWNFILDWLMILTFGSELIILIYKSLIDFSEVVHLCKNYSYLFCLRNSYFL